MLNSRNSGDVQRHLAQVTKEWDRSAASPSRVAAVHLTDDGKPLDESVYDRILECIDRVVRLKASDRVLEVGAGSGLLLERIADRVEEAVGTDISKRILDLVPPRENLRVTQMASDRLDFPDATFDAVVSYSVSLYFPNLEYARRCCAEMLRVCKPGGCVYIGDILNGYLESAFRAQEARTLSTGIKLKRIGNRLLHRGTPRYLFIEPSQLESWAGELGAAAFSAYVQTTEAKPLFHRQFRYDAAFWK